MHHSLYKSGSSTYTCRRCAAHGYAYSGTRSGNFSGPLTPHCHLRCKPDYEFSTTGFVLLGRELRSSGNCTTRAERVALDYVKL